LQAGPCQTGSRLVNFPFTLEARVLIFWHQRLVVLSVPKTGTTALEEALAPAAHVGVMRPPELKHTPAYRFERFIRPWLTNSAGGARFEAVAVMREPIDWLGSWYRFRLRADLDGTPRSARGLSFADFARAYMANPRPELAEVGQQSKFLSGIEGRALGVDRLFRYEAMEGFVAWLEGRLDRRIALGRTNPSPPADTSLPEGLRTELAGFLAEDYALWRSLG
jgi:hypothetical protein